MKKRKVVHLITGLSTGGAEMTLLKLLSRIDSESFSSEVISMTDIGEVGKKIQALGVRVRCLGMSPGVPNPLYLIKLVRWLRGSAPDLMQTWMYHADLIGGLANLWGGRVPVAWGIRHSNLDSECNKRGTIWTARACARLSHRIPQKIVCCSEASRKVHVDYGYSAEKMEIILNGFDLEIFRPGEDFRFALRRELGVSEGAVLIGSAGRYHPQKDHDNFVQAAARLVKINPDVHFVLCGEGVGKENRQLTASIEEAGIGNRCHLLGRRLDMPRFHAALDLATSSSRGGEGFPNVVGEAMACGVPCVVTDVGDSARLVGEAGLVVQAQDPEALASGWERMLELGAEGRRELGCRARRRIEEHFSLERAVEGYQALYRQMLDEK